MMYKLGNISNKRRFAIFGKYNHICQQCGNYSKGDLHLHHIQPVGCGGTDADYNLVPICSNCHKDISSGRYKGPLLKLRKR